MSSDFPIEVDSHPPLPIDHFAVLPLDVIRLKTFMIRQNGDLLVNLIEIKSDRCVMRLVIRTWS